MANVTSLLKFGFKTNLVKSLLSEISSNISKYYYVFGKSSSWLVIEDLQATLTQNTNIVTLTSGTTDQFKAGQDIQKISGVGGFGTSVKINNVISLTQFTTTVNHTISGDVTFNVIDDSTISEATNSSEDEIQVRNDSLLYKQIDANDVAIVIPRINWRPGFIFDMYENYNSNRLAYSGASALEIAEFYCLTDEFNVYKCLYNNNNSPSSSKPNGTDVVPITYEDNYIWKYMYTIPLTLRNKFLTSTLMPVTSALYNQFYSKGSIVSYSIENRGKGYAKSSYEITGFRILNGGNAYTNPPTITINPPDQPGGVQATATAVLTGGVITSIVMTNQGSGYSYSPLFSIGLNGVGQNYAPAKLEPIIEKIGDDFTTLTIVGDGVLEESPYELQNIEILTGGSGYTSTTITFAFQNPDLPNGIRAAATAIITDGVVTGVNITNVGYGYSRPFTSVNTDPNAANIVTIQQVGPGSGLTFRTVSKKNEAEIYPLINDDGEIEQIVISKSGIGYTTAVVNISTSSQPELIEDFEEASILLDFSVGDIESRQSTVELTAIPGAIYTVQVDDPGSGYQTVPLISIEGDGEDFTAEAVIDNLGRLQRVNITDPGKNYTRAELTVVGNSGTIAKIRAIISPPDGHGRDSISELFGKTIMFHTSLSKEKNKGFNISNDFRQVSILKNPKLYGFNKNLNLGLASSCFVAIGSKNQTSFNNFQVGDVIVSDRFRFRIVAIQENYSQSESALLCSYLDNHIISAGQTLSKAGAIFSTTRIILPDVNKFSGLLLSYDNRLKFSPSEEQTVIATNTIAF